MAPADQFGAGEPFRRRGTNSATQPAPVRNRTFLLPPNGTPFRTSYDGTITERSARARSRAPDLLGRPSTVQRRHDGRLHIARRTATMTVRVGINGFGRIGRQSLKALMERTPDVEVVAINDLVPTDLNALLFRYDSTYGRYPGHGRHTATPSSSTGGEIKVLAEKDPAACHGASWASTSCLSARACSRAPRRPARISTPVRTKVIISAPAKGEDITIVLGVNEAAYQPSPTTSSATPRARPTAWPPPPRWSTTSSASTRG